MASVAAELSPCTCCCHLSPVLTFMYLLKTPRISSLMLGCSTARSRSMDTIGSVKLRVEGSGGGRGTPCPGPV